jgi:hypothetical protein
MTPTPDMLRSSAYWAARYKWMESREEEERKLLDAMERIDEARYQLIKAQNDLAGLVRGMEDVGQEDFSDFYGCGGCTAEDWQDWIDGKFERKPTNGRGHVRLIR